MQKFTYILIVIIFIVALIAAFIFITKPYTNSTTNNTSVELVEENLDLDLSNEAEPEEKIPYLTDEEYDEKVLNYQGKVLIDFYTDWCYYCELFSPIIEEVSLEKDDIKYYRVNAEEELNIADTNQIMSYPTIVLFENGVEINRCIGMISKEELIDFLDGITIE